MPASLLLDLSHTSHTRARTGIQRVARSLQLALAKEALAITHDPYLSGWRPLEAWELANLDAVIPAQKRSAQWPVQARVRGRLARWMAKCLTSSASRVLTGTHGQTAGVVVPELFSAVVGAALPDLFAAAQGPRIAIFHDAIALKLPELNPPKTVARVSAYLRELLMFDGVAAVSEDSRQTLVDYWKWLGITETPEVVAIPLGVDFRVESSGSTNGRNIQPGSGEPVVLSVGSIEGRKNHLALLNACEELWVRGARFKLHLVGILRQETARPAIERIRQLVAAGRPLLHDCAADDLALAAAYRACSFTVYPSLLEGFGLPVLESLSYGKPCICSGQGALGESARGGGCVALEDVSAGALAHAIEKLLLNSAALRRLRTEAESRTFRNWSNYAADLTQWMATIKRRQR